MKFRPVIVLLALLTLLSFGFTSVRAHADATDTPPAYAIAQRLLGESNAARDYARALAAANKPGPDLDVHGLDGEGNPASDPNTASYQHHLSRLRAAMAADQYLKVSASATYGHTIYAPEACYLAAIVQKYYMHDNTAAMASLQLIENKYSDVAFPEKAQALAMKAQLANQINYANKTTFPGSILYSVMDFFVHLTGAKPYSYALAILMISVLVRLAVTPLSNKTYKSMKEQQKLQPLIKEIQAKYKDDKELIGKKTMELYTEHGINPAAGCIPMVIQLPVFFTLMYMIRLYQYQFVAGTFLWIGSPLSHMFPSFLATNLSQIDIPLMILYGGSMYLQQRMMTPADPQQAEQQRTMAIMSPMITVFFTLQYHLPSAFVLYYLVFNLLSMLQQKIYMKKRQSDDLKNNDLSTPAILLNGNGTNGAAGKNVSANGNKNANGSGEKIYGKPEPKSIEANGSTKSGSGQTSTPSKTQAKKRRRQ